MFYDLRKEKKYVDKLAQLKWYSYIDTKRHEGRILSELEGVYGKDAVFVIGDWSKGEHLNFISTPNTKIPRLLATKFKVYLIGEFRTSKLYNKNLEIEVKNLKVNINYKHKGEEKSYSKELHSVLTFQLDKSISCINRDYNAVLNMSTIVDHLVKTGERPLPFSRSKKVEQNVEVKKILITSLTKKVRKVKIQVGETEGAKANLINSNNLPSRKLGKKFN